MQFTDFPKSEMSRCKLLISDEENILSAFWIDGAGVGTLLLFPVSIVRPGKKFIFQNFWIREKITMIQISFGKFLGATGRNKRRKIIYAAGMKTPTLFWKLEFIAPAYQ